MNLMRRIVLSAAVSLVTINAYAGKDPIGWSQSGSVPAITKLHQSYSVSFTVTSNLPFTMPTPLKISNNSTPSNQVTMHDSCSGQKLAPNGSCDVGLVLVPTQAGEQQLSIFMEYGKNKVQIPKTPIKSKTLAEAASQLQGVATNGLPSAIRSSSTYVLTFTFSNTGSTPLTGFAFAPNSNNSAGYSQTSATNCGSTLPAGGPACVITGTFTTTAGSGAVSVGYTGTSGSLTASPTTSSVINNSSGVGTRTFNFVNKCTQDIAFAMNGGGLGISGCTQDSDCDAKTHLPGAFACGITANGGKGGCFWKNPAPTDGNFVLPKNTGMATVYLTEFTYTYTPPSTPENPNPGPVTAVWSGNVSGRTGCTSSTPGSCNTAYCGSTKTAANANCAPGVGFQVPASLAEMTLQPSGDSYDLSVINGLNVPMSMAPDSGTTNPNNPYTCGTAGAITDQGSGASGTLGACAWDLGTKAPSFSYVWVANGGTTSCSSNATCTAIDATYACGLSLSEIQANTSSTHCATWLGYWTADQVCGTNGNYDKAPYNCTNSADGGVKFTQMYACAGSPGVYNNSCYSNGATSSCCGCQNWQDAPTSLTIPDAAHGVEQCVASNTTWINNARDTVSWIKAACPSSYVYPFDDKSSSFTCNNSTTANSVSYTITFCPGSNNGAPTGTTPS
ncbi:MAG TPA: thaumatin family protein [Gammaproteobacteria bacterium]|nr:thaumatin family protein [Gammaproteobacteria bacterium]